MPASTPPFEEVRTAAGVALLVAALAGVLVAAAVAGPAAAQDAENATVYVGSSDGNVYAIDPVDGSAEWTFDTGEGGVFSSPTASEEIVYVGTSNTTSDEGILFAINASTGTEVWNVSPTGTGMIRSSPTIVNDTVFFSTRGDSGNPGNSRLYAVDAADGSIRWTNQSHGGFVTSSPSVANGLVYIGTNDNSLYAFNESNGVQEWSFATGDQISSSPTPSGQLVYVGSEDGNLYAVNATTGAEVWNASTSAAIDTSSPTVVGDQVFIGSTDNGAYGFDASDGSQLWNVSTGDDVRSSPTVENGTVFVGSDDGDVYAIDANTGSVEWTASTAGQVRSSPTVGGGMVYVGSDDSRVYAFAIENGTEQWTATNPGDVVRSSPTYVSDVDGNSSGTRVLQRTLGHTEGVYTPEDLVLDVETYMRHGTQQTHTVTHFGEDVTDNTTVTSSNPDAIEVNQSRNLLLATSNESVNTQVTITAEHGGSTVTETVTVATADVEHLDILPVWWKINAVLSDWAIIWILGATLGAVTASRFATPFAGVGAFVMFLVGGWVMGDISTGILITGTLVAIFLGLNLAANVDTTIRTG